MGAWEAAERRPPTLTAPSGSPQNELCPPPTLTPPPDPFPACSARATMLIKEYRICMPLTTEEVSGGQWGGQGCLCPWGQAGKGGVSWEDGCRGGGSPEPPAMGARDSSAAGTHRWRGLRVGVLYPQQRGARGLGTCLARGWGTRRPPLPSSRGTVCGREHLPWLSCQGVLWPRPLGSGCFVPGAGTCFGVQTGGMSHPWAG